MFDFKENDEKPRRPGAAALSKAFLAMVGLTVVAMVAIGSLLIWAMGKIPA